MFEKISYEQWVKDFKTHVDPTSFLNDNYIKQLYDEIKLPTRGSEFSAGHDFYIPYMYTLNPNKNIILTGIRWNTELDTESTLAKSILCNKVLLLFARSSTAKKYGFALMNKVGVVDMDYYKADNEGHIMLLVDVKSATSEYTLNQGDKIAQGVILPYYVEAGTELVGKERTGGFGSTGK